MTGPQEPLISNHGRDDDHDDDRGGLFEDAELDPVADSGKTDDRGPSIFVLVLTFAAGISGLLFGCMFEGLRM